MSKKRLYFLDFYPVDNYRYLRFLFYVARAVALATPQPKEAHLKVDPGAFMEGLWTNYRKGSHQLTLYTKI